MVRAKTGKGKVAVCKDCRALPFLTPGTDPIEGMAYRPRVDRPAPHPGPRCASHNRVKVAADKAKAHGNRVEKIYGITIEFYWKLYEFQNGVCYICRIATGAKKKLSVDHWHGCEAGHDPEKACPLCVRGLLCGPCNKDVVGHLRSNPDAFRRGVEYLEDPPARRLAALIAA
jgi:hypothetical protein